MMVVSRRVGDQVLIGNDISVTVVSVRGGKVRLGVVAPNNVRVDRLEVHQRRCAAAGIPDQVHLAMVGAPDPVGVHEPA